MTPSTPARPPITDLPESPALSILRNGPDSFEGRKVGILVTDGSDANVLEALLAAVQAAGATIELIAPKVGGVTTSDGKLVAGEAEDRRRTVGALRRGCDAGLRRGRRRARRTTRPRTDFVSDAYAHCKFIGYVASAVPLLEAVGVSPDEDGLVAVDEPGGVDAFVSSAADLRVWSREALVHQT